MKNRASLVLMEVLVMLLVFALSAALCLQIFVKSDSISRDTARLDDAVLLAQNGAEAIKAARGDPAVAAQILDAHTDGTAVMLDEGGLTLRITPEDAELPGLGTASVSVFRENTPLYCLQVGWQEVAQ